MDQSNDLLERIENLEVHNKRVESDWNSGEPTIVEPDKLISLEWHDFSTLPQPLFEPCWQNLRSAKPLLFN